VFKAASNVSQAAWAAAFISGQERPQCCGKATPFGPCGDDGVAPKNEPARAGENASLPVRYQRGDEQ